MPVSMDEAHWPSISLAKHDLNNRDVWGQHEKYERRLPK